MAEITDSMASSMASHDKSEIIEVHIPENTVELYKILSKCKLLDTFDDFLKEEFNDDSLKILDPENQAFWHIIPKIIPKAGEQLRFYHALCDRKTGDDYDSGDNFQDYYNSFNANTVSSLSYL